MSFSAENLPQTLKLDAATGIITGSAPRQRGEYPVTLKEFTYTGTDGTITKDDLGTVVGNAEHAWGFLA